MIFIGALLINLAITFSNTGIIPQLLVYAIALIGMIIIGKTMYERY